MQLNLQMWEKTTNAIKVTNVIKTTNFIEITLVIKTIFLKFLSKSLLKSIQLNQLSYTVFPMPCVLTDRA